MTPSTEPLKIGLMSLAHPHVNSYVAALKRHTNVEICAADPGPHPAGEVRGAELAAQLSIDCVSDYAELARWSPDAVIIASETAKHRALIELAVEFCGAILCEKPLATNAADAAAIERIVRKKQATMMMAYPVRFATAFTRLKDAYDAGELGQLVTARGRNNGWYPHDRDWFTNPLLSGGGALVDHVVHIAQLLDELMGARAVTVNAATNRILQADHTRVETSGLVTITYDNGVVASVDCSWSHPHTAPTWGGLQLTVGGTQGQVEIDFFGTRVVGINTETGRSIELPYGQDYDESMIDAFLATVRESARPVADIETGLRTLAIVLAAQESAATGGTVTVSDAC